MNHPIWLIAGREFRAYVTTASFWLALAIGPLLTGGAMLAQRTPPAAQEQLAITAQSGGGWEARFSDDFPLSPAGRERVLQVLRGEGQAVQAAPARPPREAADLSRFLLVLLLWVTLVGSLGMLLQAVVRERANRALEILLSAARPLDVVLGKVLGVGAVSVLVIGAWLAAPAAAAMLAPGPALGALAAFADPWVLMRAAVIYGLAFGFYGFLTVAAGVMARDSADAQNLARPMFAVLLVAFFTTMAAGAGAAEKTAWLTFLPPFTPFMLLVRPAPLAVEVVAIAELALATVLAGWGASEVLRKGGASPGFRWPRLLRPKTSVRDY